MSEVQKSESLMESNIYKDPTDAFNAVIEERLLQCLKGEERNQFEAYIKQVVNSDDQKDPAHQMAVKPVLQALLASGHKYEAGLLFNIHRTFTEFSGYGANDKASSDVEACFGENFEIPEKGKIFVDFFVTQNLPKIVEICERRGVDLSRIIVSVPMAILAAQLMKMSPKKREEFEKACAKLSANQFGIEDVNHVGNMIPVGPIAVWFSPRTMPIYPRLHAETEAKTIENYRNAFAARASQVVSGGRIYANLAYPKGQPFQQLRVEEGTDRKTGELQTKLSGMSESTAVSVVKFLVDELGFEALGKGEFDPSTVNPAIDHAKLATELHVRKR